MRPIDADALKDKARELIPNYHASVVMNLFDLIDNLADNMPTIDAVPVTRCRDCKHRKAKMGCYGNGLVLCNDGVWRDMEFFCADGERSEE